MSIQLLELGASSTSNFLQTLRMTKKEFSKFEKKLKKIAIPYQKVKLEFVTENLHILKEVYGYNRARDELNFHRDGISILYIRNDEVINYKFITYEAFRNELVGP